MLLVMIAHLFTVSLRQMFKKTPIPSMPMAKALLWASILADKKIINNTLRLIEYHLKRNMKAYQSHKKKKILELCFLSL